MRKLKSLVQLTSPCSDCPWRRNALPAWLGRFTAEEWLRIAGSETRIDCHVHKGPQCAGAAIYRANTSKLPRSKDILLLSKNAESVFSSPGEFMAYHGPEEES